MDDNAEDADPITLLQSLSKDEQYRVISSMTDADQIELAGILTGRDAYDAALHLKGFIAGFFNRYQHHAKQRILPPNTIKEIPVKPVQPLLTHRTIPNGQTDVVDTENNKDIPTIKKSRVGRKPRSTATKKHEKELYDGWVRFSEARVGNLKVYAEDNSMTKDEMRLLIDRNRPRTTRKNSEK